MVNPRGKVLPEAIGRKILFRRAWSGGLPLENLRFTGNAKHFPVKKIFDFLCSHAHFVRTQPLRIGRRREVPSSKCTFTPLRSNPEQGASVSEFEKTKSSRSGGVVPRPDREEGNGSAYLFMGSGDPRVGGFQRSPFFGCASRIWIWTGSAFPHVSPFLSSLVQSCVLMLVDARTTRLRIGRGKTEPKILKEECHTSPKIPFNIPSGDRRGYLTGIRLRCEGDSRGVTMHGL